MDKKESFYWNVVKGTAIFLMLWGHCIQYASLEAVVYLENIAYRTIYSFHMPVFMLVSGYLFFYSFEKRKMPDLLEHRIRGMLQPIIMATVLNNVLMLIPQYVLSGSANVLFGSLFDGIKTDLWFLWAVLYCSLVVGICCKGTENPCLQIFLSVIGSFVILLFPQWNMTLFMYPYFVIGFFCGKYRKKAIGLYRMVRYALLLVFPVMMRFYETKHFIYITPMFSEELGLAASLEIALFRWGIGLAGSIWMLTVMELLLRLAGRIPALQWCLQRVSHLGSNSLQIYCLSASLLSGYLPHLCRKAVDLLGYNPFFGKETLYSFLYTPLLAAVWSVFLYAVVLALKKCRVHKLIFGR